MNRLLLPIFSLALIAVPVRAATLPTQLGAMQDAADSAPTFCEGSLDFSLLVLDRSLVEREQERIEADCATPEDSPSAAPFSLSRPQDFVSNEKSVSVFESSLSDAITGADTVTSANNMHEPASWALFGLGAAFLVFVRPSRGGKSIISFENKK